MIEKIKKITNDHIIVTCTVISIIISIITYNVGQSNYEVSLKELEQSIEANKISTKNLELWEETKIRELEVRQQEAKQKMIRDLSELRILEEMWKWYSDVSFTASEMMLLMWVLTNMHINYENDLITEEEIENNFFNQIEFACRYSDDKIDNIYRNYPEFYKMCSKFSQYQP